jgi:hypothetical protein
MMGGFGIAEFALLSKSSTHISNNNNTPKTFTQALRLKTPISSTDHVKPIAYNTDPNFPSEGGQPVKGYGFGRTDDGSISQDLREADFQYVTQEDCASRTVQFSNVILGEDVMCTEGTTTSTCTIKITMND